MTTIAPLDRLFVSVLQNGTSRYSGEFSGVSSFSDIVNSLRLRMPELRGLTTLCIRNSTEGWTSSRSIMLLS